MRVVAVDFETFYDKKDDFGIDQCGIYGYTHDERFEAYLVAIYDGEGVFVGNPVDFDWDSISGPDVLWVAHNAYFDQAVFNACKSRGEFGVGAAPGLGWQCTANMTAYLSGLRSLEQACEYMLGIKVDKTMRNYMNGKHWSDAVAEGKDADLMKYAEGDAIHCYDLWQKYSAGWPEWEQRLSTLTIDQGYYGVCINVPKVARYRAIVLITNFEAKGRLPWVEGGAAPLSPKALAEECRKVGILPPASLAEDSEECEEWEHTYSNAYPWVDDMRTVRKTNTIVKKLETVMKRVRDSGTEDFCRMSYACKYFGAHTGRWSGDGGFNIQNLPKKPAFGVDLRKIIVAPPGKRLIICDLAAIEPRVLAWLVEDEAFLDQVRKGISVYEAHARMTMGWTGGKLKDENLSLYTLAKARVLALGYGAGWLKFIIMARKQVRDGLLKAANFDLIFKTTADANDIGRFTQWLKAVRNKEWLRLWEKSTTAEQCQYVNSWNIVCDFRNTNRKIMDYHEFFETNIKNSRNSNYEVELPSGRILRYRGVLFDGSGISALIPRNGRLVRSKMYGGLLCENVVQATARDVFAHNMLATADAGFFPIFQVHDEAVFEVNTEDAEICLQKIEKIMSTCPDWLPGCPIGAVAEVKEFYVK